MYWVKKKIWKGASLENTENVKSGIKVFTVFLLATFPMIIFYGLRVNVGTDYASYTSIYYEIRDIDIFNYIKLLSRKKVLMELGYYLINRISFFIYDNEHTLFILTALIIFGTFFAILIQYNNISWGFATFIYLLTQYCYAVNGVRFAMAYGLVLFGIHYIITDKPIKYTITILLATLFHKTAILCLLYWLLKDFRSKRLSFFRNILLYIGIILTPVITRIGLVIASKMSMFEWYFLQHSINFENNNIKFLWRCLPVIVAILVIVKFYHIDMGKYRVLYNIELCRIPLLYMGNYYKFAARLDRYAWISEIILVPYVIMKIPNRRNRLFAYLCFSIWYLFVFFIYYIVQGGDLFPYKLTFM